MSKSRAPAAATSDHQSEAATSSGAPATGAAELRNPPAFDNKSVLQVLFDAARPALTPAELQWLSEGSSTQAEMLARYASMVANGIGCLVGGDGRDGSVPVGSLISEHDVPEMLFHFGTVFDQIVGLLSIGALAADDHARSQA